MSSEYTLTLGRINANEDEARLIDLRFGDGQSFGKGDLLMALETTKAAVEILAPQDGRMVRLHAMEGEMLKIGARLFDAEFDSEPEFEILELYREKAPATGGEPSTAVGERKVSLKAEMLARRLGVDVEKIPGTGGVLKEADVAAYAAAQGAQRTAQGMPGNAGFSKAQCVILGTGGHAKSIIQMIREAGYSIVGVVDAKLEKNSLFLDQYPVLGGDAELPDIYQSGCRTAFIGVGGAVSNQLRKRLFSMVRKIGFALPPLISRAASFDLSSCVGDATYVFPAASVGADCQVGANCIVNQGSIVCHDCQIGDHVHLAPGAIVAGFCQIGEAATVGMAATVMNNVSVGAETLIHNNVAVAKDIPEKKIITLRGAL